jgi:hypothetical protein
MARDVMILMWTNPLQGPLEGVGPENVSISLPMTLVMDLPQSRGGGDTKCIRIVQNNLEIKSDM